MSSRVLQEDSSLLLTEANEPLVNENFISVEGFSTGSPVVGSTAIAQDHVATVLDITTGLPVAANASLNQDHNLVPSSVVSGSISLPSLTLVQDHSLTSEGITSSAPEVSSVAMVEEETAVATPLVTGVVEVGETPLSQNHVLSATKIRTRSPVVGTADDPNYIVKQEIEEIQQMFGGWPRRAYEVPDGKLVQAEREIESTFGDRVSIDRKAKSLIKFGKSAELGTTGLETVWTVGGNETYVSDNTISHVSSSSALDTQEIYVEGHTVDSGEFTFVTQTATLSGNTKVSLSTPLARVSRISNNDSTEVAGRVVVYEDTALSGGVPTDETKIHIDIPLGFQQSFKAATTFSNEDYYLMTGFYGAVSAKQSAAVDFYVEIRNPNGVFLPKACFTASSSGGNSDVSLDPAIIVPKNSDIRVRCETETNNAVVFGIFKGYLAKVM